MLVLVSVDALILIRDSIQIRILFLKRVYHIFAFISPDNPTDFCLTIFNDMSDRPLALVG